MNTTTTPNPARIYEVIATILERRYEVAIEYIITPKNH